MRRIAHSNLAISAAGFCTGAALSEYARSRYFQRSPDKSSNVDPKEQRRLRENMGIFKPLLKEEIRMYVVDVNGRYVRMEEEFAKPHVMYSIETGMQRILERAKSEEILVGYGSVCVGNSQENRECIHCSHISIMYEVNIGPAIRYTARAIFEEEKLSAKAIAYLEKIGKPSTECTYQPSGHSMLED